MSPVAQSINAPAVPAELPAAAPEPPAAPQPPTAIEVQPAAIDARLAILATQIKEKLAIARRHGQATLAALMDAGDRLTEAKKALDHGEWDPWLQKNFELSDRSARLYMQLAGHRARIEAKMATVATLGIRGALEQIYEDQCQEGSERQNREAFAELDLRHESPRLRPPPEYVTTTVRYPPDPAGTLVRRAVRDILFRIKLQRSALSSSNLTAWFDGELAAALRAENIIRGEPQPRSQSSRARHHRPSGVSHEEGHAMTAARRRRGRGANEQHRRTAGDLADPAEGLPAYTDTRDGDRHSQQPRTPRRQGIRRAPRGRPQHEVGHAIVGTHEGVKPTRQRSNGHPPFKDREHLFPIQTAGHGRGRW